MNQVEQGALTLLWLGAYQLVMLSGIPDYAVVNETAELAKRAGKPQWTGFVNAVLRSLGRNVTDEFAALPAVNAVPVAATAEREGRFRVLTNDTFVDPAQDWPDYFVAAFSFPQWLAARWNKRFDRDELIRLGFWFNSPAKLCLRANLLRTTREQLLAVLLAAGIEARAGQQPEAVLLEESAFVQRLPGYDEGWFAVQDESAIAAAALLDPRPGQRVLDLCAAPGGKTAHMAALMQNQGRLLATDVDGERLKRVKETCRRLGVGIVETRSSSSRATGQNFLTRSSTESCSTCLVRTRAYWGSGRKSAGGCVPKRLPNWPAFKWGCCEWLATDWPQARAWCIRRAASNPKKTAPSSTQCSASGPS